MSHGRNDLPPPLVANDFVRATLDSLLEGFQVLSADFRYVYVNPAAAAHGRTTPEELIGRSMVEAYPGIEQTELFGVLERCMRERVAAAMENHFTFPDQSRRWFELRIEPVPGGLCIHSVDIDARKTAQEALEELNRELERLVEARTRELVNLNHELDAFSYSVSHDLRTPLRALDGFAQALLDDEASRLSPEGVTYLERIRSASQRMGQIIDDMLFLGRVTSAALERRTVDLSALARTITRELREREPQRRVELVVEDGLVAECDAGLARILLENVLGNAWKFTGRRELAHISFGTSGDEPGAFAVRDDGAGFDERYASKLFKPFHRLHAAHEFAGVGIGLAIVQRIVHKHGGTIRVTSRVGEGTTVTFRLAPRTEG